MENLIKIILIGVPILIFVVRIFAAQYITELVKKIFKGRSDQKAFLIFYAFVIFLFMIGIAMFLSSFANETLKYEEPQDDQTEEQEYGLDSTTAKEERRKTDAEILLEGAKEGANRVENYIDNRKEKLENLQKEKGNRFVFQIGDLVKGKKETLQRVEELRTIEGVQKMLLKVFEVKRNKYLIFYDLNRSKQYMNQNQSSFKKRISKVEQLVKIIDLNAQCKPKQKIIFKEQLSKRKFDFEIECLECD